MSTLDHQVRRRLLPALTAGQRLDQATFHERYEAMPSDTWAELVEGVVYMPSPLRSEHGGMDALIAGLLFNYRRATPGLSGLANVTTKLGTTGEVQPDLQLRIPAESGGGSRIEDGYVIGPPELIVEIGRSSRNFDLGPKKRQYEQAGVPEYLFIGLEPEEARWFIRRDDHFTESEADTDGLLRSEVFPGLWLDPRALFDEDLDGLVLALERGLATPGHAEFVARLATREGENQTP